MSALAVFERHQSSKQREHGVLWWRISALLVVVIAFVLVLISFLNYSNYRKTYLELNQTRYLVLVKDLRQTVEAGLNIGLRPSENVRLLPAIKELTHQSGVRYISVVDDLGEMVLEGKIPEASAQAWKWRLGTTNTDAHWQTGDADTFELGMPFNNNFNIKAGAVVIGYDKALVEDATDAMLRKLGMDVVLTLFLLALLTMAGVYLLTHKFGEELADVAAMIDNTLSAATPPTVPAHVLGGGMAADINEFTALSHQVIRDITQLEHDIALSGFSADGQQPDQP